MTSPPSSAAHRTFRVALGQPAWHAPDFVPSDGFARWMDEQLRTLQPSFSAAHPTLVVLTELNGLPLFLRGAGLAARAPSFSLAIALVLFKHLPAALLTQRRTKTTLLQSVQLLLAPEAATIYLDVCSAVARRYGVYLAAGSTLTPHFRQRGKALVLADTGIYNEALLFGPDGRLLGATDKVHLTAMEGPQGLQLTGGSLDAVRVYPTPVGDLGVATSLDAFKPDVIARLEDQGATVLVQPDANGVMWTAEALDGTGRDQPLVWLESSWQAVQQSRTLRYGLNPMVVGNFLGEPFDGQSAIVSKPAEAPEPTSYVMTPPRPGFLRLMPWVTTGDRATLQAASKALAPGSGDPRENQYRTGTLNADLTLPPSTVMPPPPSMQEQALQAYLDGHAHVLPDRAVQALRVLWPALWALIALLGLRALLRRQPSGATLLLLGLVGLVVIRG